MRGAALALVLLGAAGCAPEAGGAGAGGPSGPVSAEALDAALQACVDGDPEAGIARLDSVLGRAPASVDALTVRGLCRWTRYAADPAGADAEAAYDDLTSAIEAAEDRRDTAFATPLDRIYSHRAFVARARGDGWDATVADLSAALRVSPGNPTHLLDRGVAHRFAGDTAAARADLRQFLVVADSADEVHRDMVAEMLDEMEPDPEAGDP